MIKSILSKIKNISLPRISFHPLFLVYLTYLFLCGDQFSVVVCLLAVFLHESGHYIVSNKLGKKVSELVFYPYGAVIEEDEFSVDKNEWKIALAGPITSLILGLLCGIVLLIVKSDIFWSEFLNANITIFIFNLLPVYPLDGGRAILSVSKKPLNVIKILRLCGVFVAILLITCFIISSFNSINYSFLIMGVFLLIGAIRGMEREMSVRVAKTLLATDKQYKKGIPVTQIAFDENTPIHRVISKFSPSKVTDVVIVKENKKIDIIDEQEFLQKAITKDACTKIKEIS